MTYETETPEQRARREARGAGSLCMTCQWGSRYETRQTSTRCLMEPERRETGAQRAVQSWLWGLGDGTCPCYQARPVI